MSMAMYLQTAAVDLGLECPPCLHVESGLKFRPDQNNDFNIVNCSYLLGTRHLNRKCSDTPVVFWDQKYFSLHTVLFYVLLAQRMRHKTEGPACNTLV